MFRVWMYVYDCVSTEIDLRRPKYSRVAISTLHNRKSLKLMKSVLGKWRCVFQTRKQIQFTYNIMDESAIGRACVMMYVTVYHSSQELQRNCLVLNGESCFEKFHSLRVYFIMVCLPSSWHFEQYFSPESPVFVTRCEPWYNNCKFRSPSQIEVVWQNFIRLRAWMWLGRFTFSDWSVIAGWFHWKQSLGPGTGQILWGNYHHKYYERFQPTFEIIQSRVELCTARIMLVSGDFVFGSNGVWQKYITGGARTLLWHFWWFRAKTSPRGPRGIC